MNIIASLAHKITRNKAKLLFWEHNTLSIHSKHTIVSNKFINRFNQIEKHIKNDGSSIEKSDLETMDRIWVQIKKSEKNK